MSNDARKLQRYLALVFGEYNPEIDTVIAMEHAILRWYPKPILTTMENMITKAKPEKLANYADFSYHLPGLRRITSKRSTNPPELIGWVEFKEVLQRLEPVIIVDYNVDVLLAIIELAKDATAKKFTMLDLANAVNVSREAKVYSVQYAVAVLHKKMAERQESTRALRELENMAEPSKIVDNEQTMTFMEKVAIQERWKARQSEIDMETKMRNMIMSGKIGCRHGE